MKRLLTSQIVVISIILQLVSGHAKAADRTREIGVQAAETTPYMGGEVDIITFSNGAVINKDMPKLMTKTVPLEPKVVKVTDGIWSLEGYALVNCGVIEGETGLIVYDTGDDNVESRRFLEAIRTFSDKPIVAIVYSHAHYVWGGRALLEGNENALIIGHPNINRNILESGGLGAAIPELAPVLIARTLEQFNYYLPVEGKDASISASPLGAKDKEFMQVNKPVKNGEIIEVDGVKIQFFTAYHSDTDDCLFMYLPEKQVVFSNLYWPTFPNLYTLRGSLYRDPRSWMAGLRKIRDLAPEHLVNTHTFAVSGKKNVAEAIINYHDGLAFVYDQAIRHILLGETPEELRHSIQLPQHLANWPTNQMTYGELSYYPPNIYYYALGWFNADATSINPVHPDFEAKGIVEGFGGKAKMVQAIKMAVKDKQYAWATQLAGYLYRVFPEDQSVRQLKADVLRTMGQLAKATIPRSWYLTQANALENKVVVVHAVLPTATEVLNSTPGTYVDMLRVRIDPHKSVNTNKVLVFDFSDVIADSEYGLHLRKGIAEFIPNPDEYYRDTDVTITLPRPLFAQYYIGEITIDKLLSAEGVKVTGGNSKASKLLSQFDQYHGSVPNMKFQRSGHLMEVMRTAN